MGESCWNTNILPTMWRNKFGLSMTSRLLLWFPWEFQSSSLRATELWNSHGNRKRGQQTNMIWRNLFLWHGTRRVNTIHSGSLTEQSLQRIFDIEKSKLTSDTEKRFSKYIALLVPIELDDLYMNVYKITYLPRSRERLRLRLASLNHNVVWPGFGHWTIHCVHEKNCNPKQCTIEMSNLNAS